MCRSAQIPVAPGWAPWHVTLFCSLLLAGFPPELPAQADDDEERFVARVSLIAGDVSMQRADSGELVAAALNTPLTVGDLLLTGAGAKAEVQFDFANFIRLDENAELRPAELERSRLLLQLAAGTATFRVLRDSGAEVEISTPNASLRPVLRGTYRVTVRRDGVTEITVRDGEAEIFTANGSERIKPGRTIVARGQGTNPEYKTAREIPRDAWDQWNVARDRDLLKSKSYDYLSSDIMGAEDLDDHGRWVTDGGYGTVWAPQVASNWAPYRYGRWSWMDYYGWTWISHDPWGWAPFHYGRWYNSPSYGWCWWPGGGRGSRQRWSPGVVAFVGFGNGGYGGYGPNSVGWIPLGPREPFYPWWGSRFYRGYRSGGYGNRSFWLNQNINIANVYRNSVIGNAVTSLDFDGFANGRIGQAYWGGHDGFRGAGVWRGQLPVVPNQGSLRWADRNSSFTGRPVGSNRFFSRRQPPPMDRIPFEEQRRGLDAASRRAFTGGVGDGPVNPGDSSVEGGSRGWTRFGSDRGESRVASPNDGSQSSNAGRNGDWQRFGSSSRGVRGDQRTLPGSGRDSGRGSGFGMAPGSPSVENGVSGTDAPVIPPSNNGGGGGGRRDRSSPGDGWQRFGAAPQPPATIDGGNPGDGGGNRGGDRGGGGRGGDRGMRGGDNNSRGGSAAPQGPAPANNVPDGGGRGADRGASRANGGRGR